MSECPECDTLELPVMVEIWGVYDGGLFFVCNACSHAFHRWPEGHRLHMKAQIYIDMRNKKVRERGGEVTR